MDLFNRIVTAVFDWLLAPFGQLPPVWGLLCVSIATGAAMVWLFGRISNQQRIRALKAAMMGHLLEVWLFRDQLRNVLKAETRVLRRTGKYFLCSLPAFLMLMIPVVVIMIQLQARYGYRPFRPGERFLVRVLTANSPSVLAGDAASGPTSGLMDAKLHAPDGLVQETAPLRIERNAEIDFRVLAAKPGMYQLGVQVAGQTVHKTVAVGPTDQPISSQRSGRLIDRFLSPIESGLPAGPIVSVEIVYPPAAISICGWQIHWIWVFLVVSLAAGYALKGVFGVAL